MSVNKSQSLLLGALSSFFILLGFWITLAPTQLGGPVTYAIVDGISMEKRFHLGDLILARAVQNYQVGDVVVYRNEEMKSFVFHRIIGLEADRFILKGDNNTWLDSYHPTRDEVVGKLWMHIPKLGKAIGWARTPINMSLTAGLLGVILMSDILKKPAEHKRNKRLPSDFPSGMPAGALYIFGLITLASVVFSVYSFTRPLSRPIGDTTYTQEGYYSYSATGTPGVYDKETVQVGEPDFPILTCFLNIGLTYNLTGANFQGTTGKYQMVARIMDEQTGWQRTIPLNPGTAFSGNSFFTTTTLDLCQIESLVTLVEQEAGLKQTAYTLEIVTDVALTSEADGNQVTDSFSPTLVFTYNKVQFYLAGNNIQSDPLHSLQQGTISNPGMQPNTITLLGLALPVWIIRYISVAGFAISLFGLGFAGVQFYQTASQSQEKLIDLKYGSMIVDIPYQRISPSFSIIDLATFDDLTRLAEKHGTMILHMSRNSAHSYFVQDNGTVYRYFTGGTEKDNPAIEPMRPENVGHKNVIIKEPAPTPTPIYKASPVKEVQGQSKPMPATATLQNEYTQPVPVHPVREKDANSESAPEEFPEYFIDIGRLKKARPPQNGSIEYVIKTGVIEYAMPQQDTILLGKIKL
ncbi:MAG: signal peptidase I [Anaerolineae bacterium]|nr:signal peptidase I [Anaerolineae bacterium]